MGNNTDVLNETNQSKEIAMKTTQDYKLTYCRSREQAPWKLVHNGKTEYYVDKNDALRTLVLRAKNAHEQRTGVK